MNKLRGIEQIYPERNFVFEPSFKWSGKYNKYRNSYDSYQSAYILFYDYDKKNELRVLSGFNYNHQWTGFGGGRILDEDYIEETAVREVLEELFGWEYENGFFVGLYEEEKGEFVEVSFMAKPIIKKALNLLTPMNYYSLTTSCWKDEIYTFLVTLDKLNDLLPNLISHFQELEQKELKNPNLKQDEKNYENILQKCSLFYDTLPATVDELIETRKDINIHQIKQDLKKSIEINEIKQFTKDEIDNEDEGRIDKYFLIDFNNLNRNVRQLQTKPRAKPKRLNRY